MAPSPDTYHRPHPDDPDTWEPAMGRIGAHPPCCTANGHTEGEHDADCDRLPANIRRRAERVAPEAAAVWFGPPPAPCTSGAVTVHAGGRVS